MNAKQPWLEVDVVGLRKTLQRKGKAWAIFELVQNAWDEDASEVVVTLTEPENGVSTLRCLDNSPGGYRDLSTAHRIFAESYKKADPTKRGRFNAGEKYVLVLCDEARITSTTGTVIFNRNKTRSTSPKKTKMGSEFYGVLQLTPEEYAEICKQVPRIFPPIKTTFNGVEISARTPIRVFQFKLPTEVADENGVLRPRQRETEVRLYDVLPGETAMLYEKGLPVVELDVQWHTDVQQKVPLNIERDNVRPAYRRAVNVAVVNEMAEHFKKEETAQPWVQEALGDNRVKDEAIKTMLDTQYGTKRVLESTKDRGSNLEAVSQGFKVVPLRALSKDARANALESGAIVPAHEIPELRTDYFGMVPLKVLDPSEYDDDQKRFVRLIEEISPRIINHAAKVRIIRDDRQEFLGCTRRWKAGSYEFEINLAYHDCSKWPKNFELLIHELAHHRLQTNEHLRDIFYKSVTEIGASLVQWAIAEPELFPEENGFALFPMMSNPDWAAKQEVVAVQAHTD